MKKSSFPFPLSIMYMGEKNEYKKQDIGGSKKSNKISEILLQFPKKSV